MENKIDNFLSTEIEWIPLINVEVPPSAKDDTVNFLEYLEEDDDVQNVFTNFKI